MTRRSRSVLRTILIAAAGLLLSAELARAQVICPPTVDVDQKASATDAAWTVSYSGLRTELAGVTIFEGPPSEMASLAPDDTRTMRETVVQTWKLPQSDKRYWIKCSYENTAAELSREMPAAVTSCKVVFERNVHFADGRSPVKSAECGSITPAP